MGFHTSFSTAADSLAGLSSSDTPGPAAPSSPPASAAAAAAAAAEACRAATSSLTLASTAEDKRKKCKMQDTVSKTLRASRRHGT
jgi:hypothetical protein